MPVRTLHCTYVEDAVHTFLEDHITSQLDTAHVEPGKLDALLPPITERSAWEALSDDLKAQRVRLAEKALQTPWTQLLTTDYLAFTRTGNRVDFEKKFFARRRKLSALVIAECIEDQGRFLDEIVNGLYLILEEIGWCLPAHNSLYRDQPQLPLQDPAHPVVDLFAAETGAIVSLTEYLLRQRLASVSPVINETVRSSIDQRILHPYLTHHFWWMGDGKSQMLNWTPWITQNVLLCLVTGLDYNYMPTTSADGHACTSPSMGQCMQILQQSALSLDFFLDEYGDDGCCSEGAQYYGHAGLCLFGALQLLDTITNGAMETVFHAPLVQNIADYIMKMYVGDGYYINFADCSPLPGRRGAREYLFAKSTGNAAMSRFAASDYASLPWTSEDGENRLLTSEENLYYHVLQTMTHEEMLQYTKKAADAGMSCCTKTAGNADLNFQDAGDHHRALEMPMHAATAPARTSHMPSIPDAWFPSVGLMIARDSHFVLAAKAGNNADSHNHNDVGSIIVYKDNRPFLIDLGVETYTSKTFSADRYDIWTMQSQYHNLPTFYEAALGTEETIMQHAGNELTAVPIMHSGGNELTMVPVMQHDGIEYEAADVHCTLGADAASLSMDIAPAYACPAVRHYYRNVSLLKEDHIVIEDHYDGDYSCVLSLITYETPVVTDGHIAVGDLGSILVDSAGSITIEEFPITDPRLQIAWKHSCYRICITLASKNLHIELR